MAKNRIYRLQIYNVIIPRASVVPARQREGDFCGLGRRTVDLQPAAYGPAKASSEKRTSQHSAEADARRRAKEDKIRGELTVSPSPSLTGRPDCVTVERGVTVASQS
ncbi:Hypothetical predicted protein [Olea europaea subsp. europaea]|uniref:Uncharacterized protein n=1 Tax=Olea europaea subsp. europaea TaxID=158383 RepID=A0A8S0TYA4_OLEEU|nr:Hypothetical predicted protein [Olea europaea subsp. europaea]